ncbi:unnamed protein product [Brassica oleracea var. botrytis]
MQNFDLYPIRCKTWFDIIQEGNLHIVNHDFLNRFFFSCEEFEFDFDKDGC